MERKALMFYILCLMFISFNVQKQKEKEKVLLLLYRYFFFFTLRFARVCCAYVLGFVEIKTV